MLADFFSLVVTIVIAVVVVKFLAGLFTGGQIKVKGGGAGFLGHLAVALIMGSLRLAGTVAGWLLRGLGLGSVAAARSLGRAAERRASRASDGGAVSDGTPTSEPPRQRHRPSSSDGPGPVVITRRRPDGGTEEVWRSGR